MLTLFYRHDECTPFLSTDANTVCAREFLEQKILLPLTGVVSTLWQGPNLIEIEAWSSFLVSDEPFYFDSDSYRNQYSSVVEIVQVKDVPH